MSRLPKEAADIHVVEILRQDIFVKGGARQNCDANGRHRKCDEYHSLGRFGRWECDDELHQEGDYKEPDKALKSRVGVL